MAAFHPRDVGHIPKFDGNNFSAWKFHVWLILRNNDLDGIVAGTEQAPAPIEDANHVITNAVAIKTWKQRDIAAQTFICSTIDQQPLKPIMNCRTAADMWNRLLTQHEQKARENRHFLQEKFFSYTFDKSNDVMSHISTIESLAARLNDIGVAVDDQQIITKIICTLPPSFRHAVSVWDSVPENEKTIALLTARLLKEETMNKLYGTTEVLDSAFYAKRDGNQNHGRRRGSFQGGHRHRQERKCDGCGKFGHLQRDCWHGQRASRQRNDHANMASDGWEADDHAFTSFSFLTHSSSDHWFADSGASQHMTDQRQFFDEREFSPIDHGVWPVQGIGGKKLFARGRGNISIQTRVNGEFRTGTIYDVLYVPNLGVNLLSIPALTSRGMRVMFDGETVRFLRGPNTVAVGTRSGASLYLLDISSVAMSPSCRERAFSLPVNASGFSTGLPKHCKFGTSVLDMSTSQGLEAWRYLE